jgi:hypothetical protein
VTNSVAHAAAGCHTGPLRRGAPGRRAEALGYTAKTSDHTAAGLIITTCRT